MPTCKARLQMLWQYCALNFSNRCRKLPQLQNAHEARLVALETSERTSSRRENVTAKRETKSLPVFGEKHGPVYADWCFGVYIAMEQVCEEANLITQWVDSLDTLDEITEANFSAWVRTKGQHVLDMRWALKQLYYVLTQKLTGQVKEFTQAEMGTGIIRGSTTWKRVQIHAAGMTQNQRLELLDAVSPQEGKLVRRACRAAASLGKEGS